MDSVGFCKPDKIIDCHCGEELFEHIAGADIAPVPLFAKIDADRIVEQEAQGVVVEISPAFRA